MSERLRRLLDRAGLLRHGFGLHAATGVADRIRAGPDVALALIFVLAGFIWAARTGHHSGVDPLPLLRDAPLKPGAPIGLISKPPSDGAADLSDAPVNVIAGAALAVRRRLPLTAFTVAVGALFALKTGLLWPGFLAIVICAYSAVAYSRSVASAAVLLAGAATVAASMFAQSIPPMPGWLGPFVILLPAGLAAAALRNARGRADAAARRAAALEMGQAATARAAIAEERARIARELHDVVSHHVSVMVIQAGAAGKVIDARPDLASGALTAIESSGREAMAELRHLLGLLAPVDDRLHPQPGLADLDTLVGAVRAAGQPVTLQRDSTELPHGVDLTAYRIVQEGLTNALRYAPGAATAVDIRRDGDDLVVEVSNDAAAQRAPAASGAGRGLIGLGERLRLHDGTLEAHQPPGGGFRLTARIPAATIPAAPGVTVTPGVS